MGRKSRYYRDIGESYVPLYWLPGKFYQMYNSRQSDFRPWYFCWKPHHPCHFCDSGTIFHYSTVRDVPKIWHWSYIELGMDADKHSLPLGLSFTRGSAVTLPKFAMKIIQYILRHLDEDNICKDERDALRLVEEELMFPYYDSIEDIIAVKDCGFKVRIIDISPST